MVALTESHAQQTPRHNPTTDIHLIHSHTSTLQRDTPSTYTHPNITTEHIHTPMSAIPTCPTQNTTQIYQTHILYINRPSIHPPHRYHTMHRCTGTTPCTGTTRCRYHTIH